MSMTIETAIAKANAAPSWTVNVVVWVMKPGPMAEVAMRNIAPSRVDRVPAAMRLLVGAVVAGAGSWLCDMGSPRWRGSDARGPCRQRQREGGRRSVRAGGRPPGDDHGVGAATRRGSSACRRRGSMIVRGVGRGGVPGGAEGGSGGR